MNIVFWNTNCIRSNEIKFDVITESILDIVNENNVDLLILAEYTPDINRLCHMANIASRKQFKPLQSLNGNTRIYGLIRSNYKVEHLQDHECYMIIKILTNTYTLIIAMIHGVSKLHYRDKDQEALMRMFHSDIAVYENMHTCKNTIAIGDFNVNPFELACIDADCMHAIPFPEEVKNPSRKVIIGEKLKFYNPTWKFMGKRNPPYTTYHYSADGRLGNFYWNAFDQVLIRPSLIKAFNESTFSIITQTKNHSLINRTQKPNKLNYSDHLPLFCVIKEDLIL